MRRYLIGSDEISVQEVDGMYAINLYFTLDERNRSTMSTLKQLRK